MKKKKYNLMVNALAQSEIGRVNGPERTPFGPFAHHIRFHLKLVHFTKYKNVFTFQECTSLMRNWTYE